jgi:hypothetical protein
MMKKLIFSIVFLVFYIFLSNGLSNVNAQETIQEDEYSKTTTTNLTQDFYTATGILKDVGNVTDKSTFITTYQPDGNTSTSTGKGIIMTTDGEIATYTGQDLGMTNINGTQTFKGIMILQTDSDGKLAFLDNLIGLYEYKSWLDGKKSGIIWKWK